MSMRALIEAVEWVGEQPEVFDIDNDCTKGVLWGSIPFGVFCVDDQITLIKAYNGSLDAALALHQALLPGWMVKDLHQFPAGQWIAGVYLPKDDDWPKWTAYPCHEAGDDIASRALLLAILRAVEAEGQP